MTSGAAVSAALVQLDDVAIGIADAAREAGFPGERIQQFGSTTEAAEAVPAMVQAGDVVLVKGSRSLAMEALTAAIEAKGVAS